MSNAFVFVCCGTKEHTETLEIALRFLRERTSMAIYIVTDNKRNEVSISEPALLDIFTPVELNHHQASIWLKTSLHRILPKGNRYMYLDTDVLAIGENVDKVFEQYISPIRFAADHCRMEQFSPYAVNCSCLSENEAYRKQINQLMANKDPLSNSSEAVMLEYRAILQKEFQRLKKNYIKAGIAAIRYLISQKRFQFTDQFYFDKKNKVWCTADGTRIMYQVNIKKIAKEAGLRYIPIKDDIIKPDGLSIWEDSCTHLKSYIEDKFNITISDTNWQHWNGGVFLFSDESTHFMDTWHEFTMEVFKDTKWKTRDQGTLIATVWKLGLQNHPVLNDTWNYIADYHNSLLAINKNLITKDNKTYTKPEFIHVYHQFGNDAWDIWNWVMSHKKKTSNNNY